MNHLKKLYTVGISYKETELDKRENFIKELKPKKLLERLKKIDEIEEVVLLATCLRIEYYIWGTNLETAVAVECGSFKEMIEVRNGRDAIRHIFEVVCGIDSAIPGEDHILAQFKEMHTKALEEGKILSEINVILNNAISLGKKFRAESRISTMPLSIENIAVKKAAEYAGGLLGKKIAVIGTGEISTGILDVLKKAGVLNITAVSRSMERRVFIFEKYGIETADFLEKYRVMEESDVIFSATTAPHYIIEADEGKRISCDGKKRVFVDLAVPRDVAPELAEMENNIVLNIDDMHGVISENMAQRKRLCGEYYPLIDLQINKCLKWFGRSQK